jgi:transposase
MILPQIEIICRIRGLRVENTLFADGIHINSFSSLEEPLPWARICARDWKFHTATGPRQQRFDDSAWFRPQGYDWLLSDAEWHQIESIVNRPTSPPPRTRPRYDRRVIVNAIVGRLATEAAWTDLSPDHLTASLASGYYFRWKRDGRLQEILSILHRSRRQ